MATNPKLFITAASGQLGRLAVSALLKKVPAANIVAGVRDLQSDKANALAALGVALRVADYARPDTLAAAFDGIDRLLFISGSEIGRRGPQHRNVIGAARQAGIGFVAYTSILHADNSPLFLAEEHRETEEALRDSGLSVALLRNGWYSENYTLRLPSALEHGALLAAAGDGRISAAARADYAEAAAIVLAGGDHAGKTYELAGDTAFTLTDLAAWISEITGKSVPYANESPAAFRTALESAGVPDLFVKILVDTDAGVAEGVLFEPNGALSTLIGRPTVPMRETIAAALKGR